MSTIPKTGFKGLIENWQSDLIAAISVSLVALPLSLGIAYAAGAPPITGVLSAIVGGIVTTLYRGSYVSVNGPSAGIIAVILGSVVALEDGTGQTLNYVFAAVVVSGIIQVLLGIFKLGRFAELFHSTVIQGILAAIGVIIIAKQIHIAMGIENQAVGIIDTLKDAVIQIPNAHPIVSTISLAGLLLLIFHSRISYKFFHILPAPIWVLALSIPFVYFFDFFNEHTIQVFGKDYLVGPQLLINIPDNILDAIQHPNFSKMDTKAFWSSVAGITMISTIESLASCKAIDKLDPYKRKSDLNKDLTGVGISTIVSGMLGGLPIISVIVRSTVNIHNHAKTKWANFYHGVLLLLFIWILAPYIQKVPLCALAILLVYTGFKLASPKVFKQVYNKGIEQLIFFIGTLAITLHYNLLAGIFGGLLLAFFSHFLLAKLPMQEFISQIFRSGSNLFLKKDGHYDLHIKGIANFLAAIKIDKLLDQIPKASRVDIDLSEARIVDYTILEKFDEFRRLHADSGGEVRLLGLSDHISSSDYPMALKIMNRTRHKVTPREIRLKKLAEEFSYEFSNETTENVSYLRSFYFFKSKPIESKSNCISFKNSESEWEITDVVFEEGAYMAHEEFETTICMVRFPFEIPKFTIEKHNFLEKYINLPSHKDIDYHIYSGVANHLTVKVESLEQMEKFMTDELKEFFQHSEFHHLESNGEAILIFNDKLSLTDFREYPRMIEFARALSKRIQESRN